MRCLIAVEDETARDTIAHAIETFDDVDVDEVALEECRERVRRKRYDFAVLTYRSGNRESVELWERIRDDAPELELVAVTPSSAVGGNRAEHLRLKVFAWLGVPVDVVELYGLVRRLIDRLGKEA